MRFFRALFYPFEDKKWAVKVGTAFMIAAVPLLGFFMVKGWEFETSVRVWRGDRNPLADWNSLRARLERGLIVRATEMLFNVPTYILSALSLILWVRLFVDLFRLPDPSWAAVWSMFVNGLTPRLVLMAGIVFYALAANFFYWSGYLRYIETRRYIAFFDFIENALLALRNFWDDFVVAIYTTILSTILWGATAFLIGLVAVTGIGAVLMGMFTSAVTLAVMSWFKGHLMGQLAARTIAPPRA